MKKSLFYSVAIAAALASCTQEVIEAPVNNEQDLSIRPILGEVVLTEDANVLSRFAAGAGARPVFAEGDKVGAAIMDAPKYPTQQPYNENKPWLNYDIVEYYSSNAAFTNKGGAWFLNEDQPLVEGNYLFYAPYNESLTLRSPFEVRVPQKQVASTAKAALDEYYASGAVVRVAHNFLAAENGKAQRPSVKFFDVMSYPKFTIVNNFDGYTIQKGKDAEGNAIEALVEYTGAMKVDSIQIVYKGEENEGVVIGGLLKNANVATKLAAWSKDPRNNYTADLLNADATIETYSTITTLVADGREIKKGEEAVFYAVMPAVQFAEGKLGANVYVTIDEKPYVIATADFTWGVVEEAETEEDEDVYGPLYSNVAPGHTYSTTTGTITMLPGQSYPQEELNYDEKSGEFSAKKIYGRALKLVLEGGKVTEDTEFEDNQALSLQVAKEISLEEEEESGETTTDLIDNNEEFIQFFMDMESGSDLTENEEAEIDYDNAKFAFSENTTATINAELIDALNEYTYRGSLSIEKALVIANDVKVTAIDGDKVTFYNPASRKSYPITLGEGYTIENGVVTSEENSVHVMSGATWTVPASTVIGNIRNDGTMNVGTKLTATTLANNGTLNLNAGANIINKFANNATIWVNDEDAIATIGEGNGNIKIQSSTQTSANITIKYVVVAGGNQIGHFYAANANVASVENAEKIAWVKEFHVENAVVDFTTTDLISKVVDINTIHLMGATFNDVKTFDMKNVMLNFGSNAVEITGTSVSQTTVKNMNIVANGRVVLTDIAALGSFSGYGEIYADGVTATWNGEAVGIIALEKDEVNKLYTVNTRAGLINIANMVNAGNNLAGWTVKLANDINLNNMTWVPIGNKENPFNGTFDGNGKTIYNLNVKAISNVGLIGYVYNEGTIKNVTIDGASVEGNHYVGAVCGYIYGNMTNCIVKNATINCIAGNDEDGDKAGAVLGFLPSDSGNIENCAAYNSTVTAGRDAGQIVGAATSAQVINCTVENVLVSANGTSTGENINDDIIGRLL